jgi:transposase
MKAKKAAKILGISVRQVKRLKKRFNRDGAKGQPNVSAIIANA